MMYRLLKPLLLSCLFVLCTDAARGQDLGFLLGLRYEAPDDGASRHGEDAVQDAPQTAYQTIYIAQHGDEITLVGNVPGLLIPRDSLFWRVAAKRSIYNNWTEDFIWSAPADEPPQLAGIPAYNGEYCKGQRTHTIHYAGSNYLALEQRSEGYCEDAAHPWHSTTLAVVPIDSTTHLGLPLSEVLGSPAGEALRAAAAAHLASMEKDEERARYVQEPDEANWGLVRHEGRWRLRGRLDPSEVSRRHFTDFDLDPDPLAALVPPVDLVPSWQDVQSFAPAAVDAFSAPEGELLVILHPDLLTVHPVVEGRIGEARLQLPLPARSTAVMDHWAAGAQVERWARHVRSSNPSVVVGARGNK